MIVTNKKILIYILLAAFLNLGFSQEQKSNESKMEAINIELPKPMFIGTPENMQVPNLEKPLGKPRPPFLAPKGTSNLAFGKRISSTDDDHVLRGALCANP